MSLPRVGPFVGVSRDEIFTPEGGDRKLRMLLYGAYDAFGLIGSECNGVAILDEDNKQVLVDELGKADSGYHGPTRMQEAMFTGLRNASWEHIKDVINDSPRDRGVL